VADVVPYVSWRREPSVRCWALCQTLIVENVLRRCDAGCSVGLSLKLPDVGLTRIDESNGPCPSKKAT
jgi:hypothetical protein